MRFAAIADIHGNHLALEAVLDDIRAQGIGEIVNLGDFFSGPLEAGRTADILMPLGMTSVRGNHDRYLIEQDPASMHASDAAAYRQLSPSHLDWVRSLPFDTVYRGEVVYFYDSHWYHRRGGRWVYWRDEPGELHTYRQRMRIGVEYAPPAHHHHHHH